MNFTTRQKAKRSFIAAFLSGNFSDKELREVASTLRNEPDFAVELGSVLDDLSEKFASPSKTTRADKKPPSTSRGLPLFDELMRLVRETRISQRDLLTLLNRVSPQSAYLVEGKKLPTHMMIERLLRENPHLAGVFLNEIRKRLVGDGKTDPYLELIEKRLEP